MNQKGFTLLILLLGIILIIGIACGAYYFRISQIQKPQNPIIASQAPQPTITLSSNPNRTTDWKTYASSPNFYSIQYPSNFYVHEYKDSSIDKTGNTLGSIDFSDTPYDKRRIGGGTEITITLGGNIKNILSKIIPYDNGRSDNPTLKTYTINGYSGVRAQNIQGIDFVRLDNPRGGGVYLDLYNGSNSEDAKQIFNQILSTFKFTN